MAENPENMMMHALEKVKKSGNDPIAKDTVPSSADMKNIISIPDILEECYRGKSQNISAGIRRRTWIHFEQSLRSIDAQQSNILQMNL